MRQRHDLALFDDEFGVRLREIREECWEEGRRELDAGRDVLFDWNLWSERRRADWLARVIDAGHSPLVLFLDVPLPELVSRLEARNGDLPASAHFIPVEELRRFASFLEAPAEDEGARVLRATPEDQPEAILKWVQESA